MGRPPAPPLSPEDAAVELERQRTLQRARQQRWKAKNPEAAKAYRRKHQAAKATLRAHHPDEYGRHLAAVRADNPEVTYGTAHDQAHARLRDAHLDEWREILAAAT